MGRKVTVIDGSNGRFVWRVDHQHEMTENGNQGGTVISNNEA